MSSISAPQISMGRPASIGGAALLLLLAVALAIPAVIVTMDGFDAAFIAIAGTLATFKLVSAGGLLRCRKWAMYVGFGAALLDTLLSLMTITDAPSGSEVTFSAVYIVIGVATLVLLLLPASRRAYV